MAADEEGAALDRLFEHNDSIDRTTFLQILEMDDEDDDRDFSKGIVYGFFDQVGTTFEQMEDSIEKRDLPQLSSLGHFLKGSSATLGLTRMRQSCEKIQQLGKGKDETGEVDQDEDVCLELIKEELAKLRTEHSHIEMILRRFYEA